MSRYWDASAKRNGATWMSFSCNGRCTTSPCKCFNKIHSKSIRKMIVSMYQFNLSYHLIGCAPRKPWNESSIRYKWHPVPQIVVGCINFVEAWLTAVKDQVSLVISPWYEAELKNIPWATVVALEWDVAKHVVIVYRNCVTTGIDKMLDSMTATLSTRMHVTKPLLMTMA